MLATRIAVKSFQIPANGLTVAEARILAVQTTTREPVLDTPETTTNGDPTNAQQKLGVLSNLTQGA